METARDFALAHSQHYQGGSVLLRTRAPAAAIICDTGHINNRHGEDEYIVDRRQLGAVTVLERFAQMSPNEYAAAQAQAGAGPS